MRTRTLRISFVVIFLSAFLPNIFNQQVATIGPSVGVSTNFNPVFMVEQFIKTL